jgi:pyridoxamine 5'-phosphate oxidase
MTARLPEPPPDNPLPTVAAWLAEAAEGGRRNPNAMALATTAGGQPSVRMVLLKEISVDRGYAVFYTHYRSRKAREIAATGRAAGVLYWEELGRQVRLEGIVVPSPAGESDEYFATRPHGSRINAWASAQSEPLEARVELEQRAEQHARELGADPPRPPHWGGYRLWLDAVELWAEGMDRFHERLAYQRTVSGPDLVVTPWRWQRLQP